MTTGFKKYVVTIDSWKIDNDQFWSDDDLNPKFVKDFNNRKNNFSINQGDVCFTDFLGCYRRIPVNKLKPFVDLDKLLLSQEG